MAVHYTRDDLIHFKPRHKTFVGIDSDGCAFDTMEIKQKQCFHGEIVKRWALELIEKEVRETAEFVNLYSCHRGSNRFLALLLTFDLIAERPEVRSSGVMLPDTTALRRYIDSGLPMSNATLKVEAEKCGDPELQRILAWSLAVNEMVERIVKQAPPFPGVLESLQAMEPQSDMAVVSQTPTEALVREWKENQIDGFVQVIAGQELGTKSEHLQMITEDRYGPNQILMIGDALGDLKAARHVKALFFPINPGHEAASWTNLHKEGYARFLDGTFRGDYQEQLIARFEALLPETPPWKS